MKTTIVNYLDITQNENEIKVAYGNFKEVVIFGICDFDGEIYLSGELTGESTTIDISSISPGVYVFYIVEQMKLIKQEFSIA